MGHKNFVVLRIHYCLLSRTTAEVLVWKSFHWKQTLLPWLIHFTWCIASVMITKDYDTHMPVVSWIGKLKHTGPVVRCILIFRTLRKLFKVDTADYMISICGNEALRELSSPGKSGSFFYLTNDDRYMIKTMKKAEVKVSNFSASCTWIWDKKLGTSDSDWILLQAQQQILVCENFPNYIWTYIDFFQIIAEFCCCRHLSYIFPITTYSGYEISCVEIEAIINCRHGYRCSYGCSQPTTSMSVPSRTP